MGAFSLLDTIDDHVAFTIGMTVKLQSSKYIIYC